MSNFNEGVCEYSHSTPVTENFFAVSDEEKWINSLKNTNTRNVDRATDYVNTVMCFSTCVTELTKAGKNGKEFDFNKCYAKCTSGGILED